MELLARTLRSFQQLVGHNGWFTLLIAGAVLSLELLGRHTYSDWHDVALAALLGVLLVGVAIHHHRSPLPWLRPLTGLTKALGTWLKQWLVEVGYDLRGNPPVRRGLPPVIFTVVAVFVAWSALLLAFGDYFPHTLRSFGINYFYLGYLLVMAVIWTALLIGILFSFYFTIGLIHDELTSDGDGRGPRGPSRAALALALFSVLLLLSRFVWLWQVLTLSMIAWAVLTAMAWLSSSGDVSFIWRPRASTRVRSVPAAHSAAVIFGLGTIVSLNLVVTAAGSVVWRDPGLPNTNMPLTVTLGTVLGWVLLALLLTFVWQVFKERLRAPSRPARRVLHVRGTLDAAGRQLLARHFPRRQWRLQFDRQAPDVCSAQIELVEPARSEAREPDPAWPLKVSLADLDDPEVRLRIERRSDIQVRRRIIAGLERLVRVAKRRKYRNGHGYWVAPHLSLWNGLRRDEPEPEPGSFDTHMVHDNIGPAYHRAFPHLARHLAHRMMRSLQIDLIFVEDGVTFRRFARVMRRIFDLYDKQAGRPAEDPHFVGLHGTKAIIYEFQFENPFESDVYPEPKFTALGRARILLVFRDRSEQEELVEPPFDASRTPAPLMTR